MIRMSRILRAAACLAALAGFAPAAYAAEILIHDPKSQPESLTAAPGGTLIVGSASSPFIYKVKPGTTTAEAFFDASADGSGTFFFGMLADAASGTVWACELTPVPGVTPVQRHTGCAASTWPRGRRNCAGPCPATTPPAMISPSAPTMRSISPTPPMAASIAWRRAPRRRAVPGEPCADRHRRHHLPGRRALCEQCLLQQSLSHPGGCRRASRARRWISGWTAGQGAGRHARGQRQAVPGREWQRQDRRPDHPRRQGPASPCSRTG